MNPLSKNKLRAESDELAMEIRQFIDFLSTEPNLRRTYLLWESIELSAKAMIDEVTDRTPLGMELLRGFISSQRVSLDHGTSLDISSGVNNPGAV